jgi:hypothetical protein
MQRAPCDRCYYYSPSQCPADQNICYNAAEKDTAECPYVLCRLGVLQFFVDKIQILMYTALSFMGVQIIFAIAVLLLLFNYCCTIAKDPSTSQLGVRRRGEPPMLLEEFGRRNRNGDLPPIKSTNSSSYDSYVDLGGIQRSGTTDRLIR